MRRKRALIPIAAVVALVVLLAVLFASSQLVASAAQGSSSMAPTLPACDGRYLAEGFTYRFRDPHRGELVEFHARGVLGGIFTPDPKAAGQLAKRVIGVPGDTVVGRGGRVLVNGTEADGIRTSSFSLVRLGRDEYFVMGDNRSFSQDGRDFGPVPRDAIFARVVLVFWPLGRFGVPGYDRTSLPPGGSLCD